MSYFTKHYPKEVAEKGLANLIRSEKIKFSLFSKNYEPVSKGTLNELRGKKFIMNNGGHFFFGGIDVTISEYCFYYHNKQCPPKSEDKWKNCYKHNTPCKKFKYISWNNGTNK